MRRSLRATESSLNLIQGSALAPCRGSVYIFQQEIIHDQAKEKRTSAGHSIISADRNHQMRLSSYPRRNDAENTEQRTIKGDKSYRAGAER
jgi:hypothetical protein